MDHARMTVEWANQNWALLGEKALLWVEKKTLILSDVHLGKAEDFQVEGIPVASQVHENDLLCLEKLLLHHAPKRVFILGDFVHSNRLELPHLAHAFQQLRKVSDATWTLALGNHDLKQSERLAQWAFDSIVPDIDEEGILFVHENQRSDRFQIQGHVHPVLKITSARDRLRLPCFVVSGKTLLLPAFGEFTGGFEIEPKENDAVYLVAEKEVIRWC